LQSFTQINMKVHHSFTKKIVVFLLLISQCFLLFGNNNIEKLIKELKLSNSDMERMIIYGKLSDRIRYKDTKQSIKYIKEAIVLAEKVGTENDKTNYQFKFGALKGINGDYAKAIEINTRILETRENISDSLQIEIHNIISLSSYGLGELHLAIKYGKKAILLGETFQKPSLSIPSIGCLAKINMDYDKYDEALAYFQKAKKEAIIHSRYIQEAYVNKDFAELHLYRGENQQGIDAAKQAITIAQKYNLYVIENDALINLSRLYKKTNQLDKALIIIDDVINFVTEKRHTVLLIKAMISKSAILSQMDRKEEALSLALSTLKEAEEKKLNKEVIQIHESIARLYGKKEDFKNAFVHQNKAEKLNSSQSPK